MSTIDPRREVDRRRLSTIAERASDDDEFAERLAAEVYGVRHDNSKAWYDARNSSTGTKYEVKFTHREVDNPDGQATGRYRLWQNQHERLTGAETAEGQTAYYVFVLFAGDSDPAEASQPVAMRRMHPTTVTDVLRERGEDNVAWNRSGHESQGRQHKLQWTEVIDG